ncbi:MAG TPA: 50S ribosomal protein L32 [Nitrospiraceae bacterium]|nr:50S ribosomal protein L32 [Nitrospiraceae bacterium]HBI25080.1 50S ribosomal protein L32 [Nitrospiraceae bacterium]
MPNPKHKISKSRRDKRRTHKKLSKPNFVLCPECHETKLPHHVCLNCGTYKGHEVVTVIEE